jgi:uncharacterized repeat protein (TIGR01451 family)/LPXTG-motif cell wall-anchored protein
MARVHQSVTTQMRRVLGAVLLLLGVVTTVPMFAGEVSAHHPDITGSVDCTATVSFTSTAWAGDGTAASRRNADIAVTLQIVSGSGTVPAAVHGAYTTANNYQFTGTFTWPTGANSITLTATAIAKWGNNTPAGDSRTTATIVKPTNCAGTPGVSKNVSCVGGTVNGSGTVVFTFTNTATSQFAGAVTYTIPAFNGTALQTFTVAKGATVTKTFTGVADGTYTVLITSGVSPNVVAQTQTFTVDCDSPVPSVSNVASCNAGNGKIIVTLTNSGGEAVTFAVTPPTGGAATNYTVPANSSTPVTFSGLADATYTIVVTVGATHYDQTFTVDCDHPAPAVSSAAACDTASHDGSVVVTLSNLAGTEGVTFKVTNPFTNMVTDVVVAAGASTTRTFTGFSDGTHTVTITVPGDNTNYSQTFTVACDLAPSYSYTQACVTGDGQVSVTLKNDGDDVNAVFVLQGVSHTLTPGQSKVVVLGPFADGTQTIALTVNGANKNFQVTIDCDRPGQPAVDVGQICANEDGTAIITLKNIGGQLPLTFIVNGTPYDVAADSQVVVNVPGLLDGSNTIVITQNGVHFDTTIAVSCDQAPTVDHSSACIAGSNGTSDGQVVITLHNNGDDLSVTFTVNGAPYTVAPKGSQVVTISGLTDGPHSFTVSGGGKTFDFSVTTACDHPGTPSVTTAQSCVANDGQVVVHLTATGGEQPVSFTVNGTVYSVAPNTTVDATVSGLTDGPQHITVTSGQNDFSFDITVNCDQAPTVTVSQVCAAFDGTLTVLLTNLGDDVAVTFTVNGVDYVVPAGQNATATISGLADGPFSIPLAINGVAQAPITGSFDCNPTFNVVAVCNTVDTNDAILVYWFTITNTESTSLAVTWNGGSATVPAGGSLQVSSPTAPLSLQYNGALIATAPAAGSVCTRDVVFNKVLVGQPPTGETYTIRVSRLVGAVYAEELTFDLLAGVPKIISLPSTLDPAGLTFKVEEVNAGTANTTTITPDVLKLTGNLGETISVVVTNGYASVQIVKQSLTPTVTAGGQITYTLQATNTGGLTLDPVVISDRLPGEVAFVSVSIADNGGVCALAESTRPQLLVCTMTGALPAGGLSKVITLTVKVDGSVTPGTPILNQGKVLGTYVQSPVSLGAVPEAAVPPATEASATDLSCLPAIAGTVCDLSARIGVPVSEVGSEAPVTTVEEPDRGSLPATGGSSPLPTLVIAAGLAGAGSALLISRRRRSAH